MNRGVSPCSHAEVPQELISVYKCVPLIWFLFFRVQRLFFSSLCSSLTLCTLPFDFDRTCLSSLFINYSGRSNHCHVMLSIDAPRLPKSARFICWTMSLNDSPRLLCDLSDLLHLVGNENYPRFPGIAHPVQWHHTVHPHVDGSNGLLL